MGTGFFKFVPRFSNSEVGFSFDLRWWRESVDEEEIVCSSWLKKTNLICQGLTLINAIKSKKQ